MNRQEIVCDYIQTHYVDEGRLRHDVISNRIQISEVRSQISEYSNLNTENSVWRDVTTSDINDIVCDCSKESGLSIAAKEVLAVAPYPGCPSTARVCAALSSV